MLFSLVASVHAQGPPDPYRELNNNLANSAVSAVEVFSAGKTVSAGSFQYDNPTTPDVSFSTYKLPLAYQFGEHTNTLRPFLQGYLGYFKLNQDLNLADPNWGSLDVQSGTVTVGGGVDYDLTEWLTLTPRMQVAYSHVELVLKGNPPPPINTVLASWRADALTVLPSIEVNLHDRWGLWDVAFNSQYTYLRTIGIHDSSPVISLDSESRVWRNEISTRFHPARKTLGLPLDFGALFARHEVAGQLQQSGFVDYFYEARVTLYGKLSKKLRPATELTLSGAYYFHDALTGYSIGVGLGF